MKFKEKLEKEIIARFGNPIITFTGFAENRALEIPELMRSSQALIVGQLHKRITVQLKILGALKEIDQNLG